MKSFKTLSSALGCTALLAMSTGAQALTLFPNTLLEDDNFEYQAVDINNNGLLDVGDVLTGILDITKVVNIQNSSQNYDPSELTAVFSTLVTSKTATSNPALFDYKFGAVGGDGVVFKFYTDPDNDFGYGPTDCATIAACSALSSDGTLWATFGFTGDTDEQWDANGAPDDLDAFAGFPPSVAVGNFRFALGVIDNFTGYKFEDQTLSCLLFDCTGVGGDDKVTFIGSGSVLGIQGLNTPYQASSDTDFQLKAIPEPSIVGMFGMGLLGLIPWVKRRVK